MLVLKVRVVPAGTEMMAIARQCANGDGVGVGTRVPLAVSAQAVRVGSQPPTIVRGPCTVTATCSWPADAVTTVVHPEESVALPDTPPDVGVAGVGVGLAAPGWVGTAVGEGAGDAVEAAVGDGAGDEPCPPAEGVTWGRPQPPSARAAVTIRRADRSFTPMRRTMVAQGSASGVERQPAGASSLIGTRRAVA